MQDFIDVVEASADVNTAQLVGTQSGEVLVPTYNWSGFFEGHLKKLDKIKSYQHFRFSSEKPGCVIVQESSTEAETTIDLRKRGHEYEPSASTLPDIVQPSGLSNERQWYLFNNIRVFCSPDSMDLVCPPPGTTSPPSPSPLPSAVPSSETPSSETLCKSPPRKKRRCGICQQSGHNRATCPDRCE